MFDLSRIIGQRASASPVFLALDLGSTFLKAAVFSPDENRTQLKLLSYVRMVTRSGAFREGLLLDVEAATSALKEVIAEALFNCGEQPQLTVIGLSGSAVKEFYTAVRLTREVAETPLAEKELKETVQKVKEASFIEIEKGLTEVFGSTDLEAEVVDTRLASFKVDGYPLKEPFGFTGKVLEITINCTVSPANNLEALRTVLKRLKINNYRLEGNLSALTSLLVSYQSPEINALLIDIGGQKTDIGVVFGGVLIGSRTVGLGSDHWTRLICDRLHLTYDAAEKRKNDFISRHPGGSNDPEIGQTLQDFLGLWLSGLEVALADFSGVKTFPGKVWLSGGGSLLPDLATRLQAFPWTAAFPFLATPEISPLPLSLVDRFVVNASGKILTAEDFIPMCFGHYYLTEGQEKNGVDSYFRS